MTSVQHKYNLKTETLKFNASLELTADIHLQDREVDEYGFDRTTILSLTYDSAKKITIQIDWCNFSSMEIILETLIVPETDNLFFGARFFWGIIDLKNSKVFRQESCLQFWNFIRYKDAIVVTTELEALALSLNGNTIDKVPIDPPFESKIFEDKIEFDSPVFGRQTLHLKK
jgi:hypothetical protein